MAIYHLSAQIISRSSGGSAVAAAAYRTGERLFDERTGVTHDYSRRKDKIPDVFVMAPSSAPGWVRDRGKLWNAVEAAERRKDAQLVREVNVALPRELDPEEQVGLLREYVQDAYVRHGMVAGVAVHVHDVKNPHAHIMLTTRDIGPEGFGKKNRSGSNNGLVIKILSITNGLADLDVDGSGQAASATALSALGITDAERTVLAGLYTPGQSLWRVPVSHFTAWDFNWPFGPPAGAPAPAVSVNHPSIDNSCRQSGSIIGCESQTLGEKISITGTGLTLYYQNDREAGHTADGTIEIPLIGATVPAGLESVTLVVTVADIRKSSKQWVNPA
jgi:hypothetical protein